MLRHLTTCRLVSPFPKFSSFHRSSHGTGLERFRVTVIGGAGGIGQPLSLLLRLNPRVSVLTIYDLKVAKGVSVDLSHINRPGSTIGFEGKDNLLKAMRCADIVVVPAGLPRKPGQSREDLFDSNASVIAEVADAMGQVQPEAFLAVITNPINSTIPVAAEVLKKRGVYNPSHLFGITTLDMVRAKKFLSDVTFVDPLRIKIPVIGGHSGTTIVPLISQCEPPFRGDDSDIKAITKRVQEAGTEVVEAKGGAGSATLSMAHAAHDFVTSLLIAKSGKTEVREYAYVESCLTPAKFFASEIRIGAEGIIDTVPLPELSQFEDQLMCEALPTLLEDIKKGIAFGEAYKIADKKVDDCQCNPSAEEKKEEKEYKVTPPSTEKKSAAPPAEKQKANGGCMDKSKQSPRCPEKKKDGDCKK